VLLLVAFKTNRLNIDPALNQPCSGCKRYNRVVWEKILSVMVDVLFTLRKWTFGLMRYVDSTNEFSASG